MLFITTGLGWRWKAFMMISVRGEIFGVRLEPVFLFIRSLHALSVMTGHVNPQPSNANQALCRLSLCDLAGSERHAKTHTTGERLKEAGNINTSLLTLGRCIELLRYNQQHKDK